MRLCLAVLSVFGLWLLITACKTSVEKSESAAVRKKISLHADSLKAFAATQDASTDYAILIDMDIPSSKKRFFVVDLNKDSLILSGMCAHGDCKNYTSPEVSFSNKPGSHCSSEGRYRIGGYYDGRYGKSYKLHGLDATNDKALERLVVLHGFDCINDIEDVEPACMSLGCPAVSRYVLQTTADLLDSVQKPVLMWIYK